MSCSSATRQQRKKRYIHAIPIEHVKPHYLPVKMEIPTSTPYSDKISNAQEFQRLIELQDDEIHDRVALRYLRQYVGPVLFNICDYDEASARHVYLFNSSRLVLAISNFTLDRMTVVVTPARTLLSSDAQCPSSNLECQVSGARVCIDSLSACDGVPNCGSYDIYDEDRLTCGRSAGLQHNVCLAAITFLAVLLTLLYIVHYWLKRCVPRVSDAFFIYTDAAENVLYLDPIMRSPHDTDGPKEFYRGGDIHYDMECRDMEIKRKSVSPYIMRFLRLFRWRRKSKGDATPTKKESEFDLDRPRIYSYGEVELNKLGVPEFTDMAVQTGSSLIDSGSLVVNVSDSIKSPEFDFEMEDIVTYYEGKRRSTDINFVEDRMSTERESEELSILDFFKRARSVSVDMPPYFRRVSSQ
ncbi:hypothetical protein SFRURICE_004495 [Spodoptera frugiperda]|nr:hypothetical protein SFRURICE_004495 [Spodoptera frugiperda]